MSYIKISVIVGLVLTIPILLVIDLGTNQLAKSAKDIGEIRETLAEINSVEDQLNQEIDGVEIDGFEIDDPEPLTLSYPISRRITDLKRVSITVTITGRSQTELKFYTAKNLYYSYPIKKLSIPDQEFVRKLPVVSK